MMLWTAIFGWTFGAGLLVLSQAAQMPPSTEKYANWTAITFLGVGLLTTLGMIPNFLRSQRESQRASDDLRHRDHQELSNVLARMDSAMRTLASQCAAKQAQTVVVEVDNRDPAGDSGPLDETPEERAKRRATKRRRTE